MMNHSTITHLYNIFHTLQYWHKLPGHGGPSLPEILPRRDLLEEDWDPACEHGYEIDEEEGAAAVLVAQVGEPPNIAQANAHRDAGEQEVLIIGKGT